MFSLTTLTELARHYQAFGLPSIPIRAGQPLVKWDAYQHRLPVPDDMVDWPWDRADGLAIICGHRDPLTDKYWWVLDIEPQHRARAEAWLDAEHPGWRKGLVGESQRGGLHLYCLSRQPVPTGKHPWGDIKGVGGLAFAPPTKAFKPDARHDYQWLSFQPEEALELEPTDLPWPDGASGNGHQRWEPLSESLKRTIPVGQRNVTLTRVAGWLRGEGQLEPDEVLAVLRMLNRRCEEPLPDDELQTIARSSGRWSPNPVLIVGNGHRQSLVTPYSDSDSDDDPEAVDVSTLPEPPGRDWLVSDLVPEGTVTTWFGDDGTGKSVLALALGLSVASGQPFLGRPAKHGVVLYIDTEFDQDEFVRRAYQLARGMGHSAPPAGVIYYRTRYSLTTPGGQRDIARLVERYQPTLVVLDSITLGTYTDDLKEAAAAVTLMEFLQRLPTTVLALDHIPKPPPGASQAYARPWGSFAKRAKTRHAVLITPSEAGGVVLRVTKSNLARPGTMVGADITWESDAIRVTAVSLDDESLAGVEQHLPPLEQVYRVLCQREALTPDELADETGLAVGTVKNKLTALRRQGRAEPLGDGRWRAVRPASLVTHAQDSDRDDDPGSGPSPSSLVTHYSDSDSDDDPEFRDIPHHEAKHGPHAENYAQTFRDISDPDAKNEGGQPHCLVCGTPLTWDGAGRRPQYCSPACRKRAQRQRQTTEHPISPSDRLMEQQGGITMPDDRAEVLIATGDRVGWPLYAGRLAGLTGVSWHEAEPVLQALLDSGVLVALHGDRRVMTHTILARPGCRGGALMTRTLEDSDGHVEAR